MSEIDIIIKFTKDDGTTGRTKQVSHACQWLSTVAQVENAVKLLYDGNITSVKVYDR